jgi:antitoxin component YwqK of YwqJK toxin-antitoxin module
MNYRNFISSSKILFFFILTACDSKIDYNSLAAEHESITLNCISILEVDGINYFSDGKASTKCVTYNGPYRQELRSYDEGLLNGIQIGYYPDGSLDYLGYRKDGEIDGDFVKFHLNGQIATKGQFSLGFYVGRFDFFDEKGTLIERRKYDKYGKLIETKLYDK